MNKLHEEIFNGSKYSVYDDTKATYAFIKENLEDDFFQTIKENHDKGLVKFYYVTRSEEGICCDGWHVKEKLEGILANSCEGAVDTFLELNNE